MASKSSVKKNYFYNLIYQVFTLLTPLITTPYVARVLGSSGVGQFSFTHSIATYFVLLGSLGFGFYAQREVAKCQGNKKEQSLIFWEIIISRALTVSVSIVIYFILFFAGVYDESYNVLLLIMAINIISVLFDVTFLYQGNEEFGIIAIRNVAVKVIGIVTILVFVKKESDVWIYALCQSSILFFSNISLWISLPKRLVKISINEIRVFRHFVPTLRLFIPTVAVTVYTVLDKTLIGLMVPGKVIVDGVEKSMADIENGYYDQAEKIVKLSMTIVTSLGIVMMPRNSFIISSGDTQCFKKNVKNAMRFVFFIGTPITLGLASVSFNLSPWFFGSGYEKVPYLMIVLCPLVLIIGISNVLGHQFLLPKNMDKKYTIAIISGAVINLLLNIILIPLLWSYGACIATICAEIVVTLSMLLFSKKDINFGKTILSCWKYFLSGFIMFSLVFSVQFFVKPSVFNTIILVLIGVLTYFSLLLLLKDDFLCNFLKKIRKKKE